MTRRLKLLLFGIDGGTFDLIEPLAKRGLLPNLSTLIDKGFSCVLRSTVPPATFPAWSSILTGRSPGVHGLIDFTVRVPGTYAVRFSGAADRRGATIFSILSQRGERTGAIGFPATYPPEPLDGFAISGFDSPVATGIGRDFVHPPGLYKQIRREVGKYLITDLQETRIGRGWHRKALEKLKLSCERRARIALYLAERHPVDALGVHFGETDTVCHHFWALADPSSPRHAPELAERFGAGIEQVYRQVDAAVGRLLSLAGPETLVCAVSDHGFGGAGDTFFRINDYLASQGLLRFKGSSPAGTLARWAKAAGLRMLPSSLQEQAFRWLPGNAVGRLESASRFGAIDFAGTKAFSEELNYFPSVWLNLRGRDPEGVVDPGEYEQVRSEVADALCQMRHPETGEPVIRRCLKREELYSGPFAKRAPDLVLEMALDRGYSYALLPSVKNPKGPWIGRLRASMRLGSKGTGFNGSHRPEGILILSGPGIAPGRPASVANAPDVTPTLLFLLDQALLSGMDGRIIRDALEPGLRNREPGRIEDASEDSDIGQDARRDREFRKRLKSLGYLD